MADEPYAPSKNVAATDVGSLRTGQWLNRATIVGHVASCSFLAIVLVFTWAYAWQTDRLPSAASQARYERTGHGAWDHLGDLTVLVDWIFNATDLMIVIAALRLLIGRRMSDFVTFVVSVACGIVIYVYHLNLID